MKKKSNYESKKLHKSFKQLAEHRIISPMYSVISIYLLVSLPRSHHLHLAMLAIEVQTETLAIGTHQVVRLAERRLLLVTHGAPT